MTAPVVAAGTGTRADFEEPNDVEMALHATADSFEVTAPPGSLGMEIVQATKGEFLDTSTDSDFTASDFTHLKFEAPKTGLVCYAKRTSPLHPQMGGQAHYLVSIDGVSAEHLLERQLLGEVATTAAAELLRAKVGQQRAIILEKPIEVATELSAVPASDPMEALEKIGKLRDNGVLTEDEFQAKKSELLARL